MAENNDEGSKAAVSVGLAATATVRSAAAAAVGVAGEIKPLISNGTPQRPGPFSNGTPMPPLPFSTFPNSIVPSRREQPGSVNPGFFYGGVVDPILPAADKSANEARNAAIAHRLRGRITEVRLEAEELSLSLRREADKLASKRSNDGDKLQEYDDLIRVIVFSSECLAELAKLPATSETTDSDEPIFLGKAAQLLSAVGSVWTDWIGRNKNTAIEAPLNLAVFMATYAFVNKFLGGEAALAAAAFVASKIK